MTDKQIFDATTGQGSDELQKIFKICSETGEWCLIGGLALNTYLDEPRFTRDADLVMTHDKIHDLCSKLESEGFKIEIHDYSINIKGTSRVFIQISTDPAFSHFPERANQKDLWGIPVKSACLEDLVASKVRAAQSPSRRGSKRIQDCADLERIREEYPEYSKFIPTFGDSPSPEITDARKMISQSFQKPSDDQSQGIRP